MAIVTFGVLLVLFLGIGIAGSIQGRGTPHDYYLASGSVSPALVGLSAVATNNSAFMFIGVIGYTYMAGLAAVWLLCGWVVGDFTGSLLVHQKLRRAAKRTGQRSFAAVISRWTGPNMSTWRRLAATISVISLGIYTAAQIVASSKGFEGALGWDRSNAIWLLAPVLLVYSASGGIRASIWRDAAQAAVMLASIVLMFVVALAELGGAAAALEAGRAIPGFLDADPSELLMSGVGGLILFVLGWIVAGLSVVGQPHVMVRFMALDRPQHLFAARVYYYSYFTIFYLFATGVGLLARLHLPSLADPELALPLMAADLLPPALLGVVLSGIFAAAMSTADSLVVSCSTALVCDLPSGQPQHPLVLKAASALVVGAAMMLALHIDVSVFDLVIFSWSTLGVTLGPLLILLVGDWDVTQAGAIMMTLAGLVTAVAWRGFGLHDMVYEGLPGMAMGLIVGVAFTLRANSKFASG